MGCNLIAVRYTNMIDRKVIDLILKKIIIFLIFSTFVWSQNKHIKIHYEITPKSKILAIYHCTRPPLFLFNNDNYEIRDYGPPDLPSVDSGCITAQSGKYEINDEKIIFYTKEPSENYFLNDNVKYYDTLFISPDSILNKDSLNYFTNLDSMINNIIPESISEYFRIYWDQKEYLFNRQDVLKLCNIINSTNTIPSEREFYCYKKNINKNNSNFPKLPKKFQKYLFKKKKIAKIISSDSIDNSFIINKGISDNLFEGGWFFYKQKLKLVIVTLFKNTAKIIPQNFDNKLSHFYLQNRMIQESKIVQKEFDEILSLLKEIKVGSV